MKYGDKLTQLIHSPEVLDHLDYDLIKVINEAGTLIASQTSGYNIEKISGVDHALLYGYRNDKRALETMQLGTILKLASYPFVYLNDESNRVLDKLNKMSNSDIAGRPTLFSRVTGVPRKQLHHLDDTKGMMTMNILTAIKILSYYDSTESNKVAVQ